MVHAPALHLPVPTVSARCSSPSNPDPALTSPHFLRFLVPQGFEYPEDPYVLAGSCGLQYSLVRVSGASEPDGVAGCSLSGNPNLPDH